MRERMSAVDAREHRQRIKLVKNIIGHYNALERKNCDEVTWVSLKLSCSHREAEALYKEAFHHQRPEDPRLAAVRDIANIASALESAIEQGNEEAVARYLVEIADALAAIDVKGGE